MVDPSLVPTLAEAERAALVVARAGAGKVLLFGSVAKGAARRLSDIDLMVILDDLNYADRQDLTTKLEELARAEVGCRVDVHLTDRPEWKMRTEQVVTSFENRVKGHAVLLVDKPAGQVKWDKKMVMPENDYEEAVERLHQVFYGLAGLESSLTPKPYQQLMEKEGQKKEAFAAYEQRLARGYPFGHLTVETAMKALIHLSASPEAQPWGHDIDKLLPQLHEPHKSDIETRLATTLTHLQNWQQHARYERTFTPTPEIFTETTKAACQVALYTADQIDPAQQIVTSVRWIASFIEQQLARRDLHTGRERDKRKRPGLSLDR